MSLRGHTLYVISVDFSPDSSLLVSGSWDRSIRIWDVSTGEEIKNITARGQVDAVLFMPDGKSIASTDRSGGLTIWDVASGKELLRVPAPTRSNSYLALSPDGRTIAIGGSGSGLWDVTSGKRIDADWDAEARDGGYVRISSDGRIAGVSKRGILHLFEMATGKEVCQYSFAGAFNISPCNTKLAVARRDGTALILDIASLVAPQTHASPTTQQLAQTWQDLASSDAKKAYRAVWQFAQSGEKGLSFLRDMCKTPAAGPEKLIGDLGHAQYLVRQKAFESLQEWPYDLTAQFRGALAKTNDQEVKWRLTELLAAAKTKRTEKNNMALRRLRAIQALEYNGSDTAIEILKELSLRVTPDNAARHAKESGLRIHRLRQR